MDRIIKMTVSIDYTKLIPTLVKIFGNSEARPIELHLGIALGFSNFPFEYHIAASLSIVCKDSIINTNLKMFSLRNCTNLNN